jgi:hypothetical protein
MKLFAKVMLAALVLAMLLPFTILKDNSGNTLMSFSDLKMPDFSLSSMSGKMPEVPDVNTGGNLLQGEVSIYQWYDGDGNIQFSSEPPGQGIDYEVRRFDPNANVIQPVESPRKEQAAGAADRPAEAGTADPEEIGNPYSEESIKKLFENARNIEKLLGQRLQDQENAINQ